MQPVIECVPNFSEGRDRAVIDAIAAAIRSVKGVNLLDVDPGADTHRTVVTFVGAPEAVVEAAFQAIRCASERIDMRNHRGAHPRMGATDVCPLIPIQGISLEECTVLAGRLGERVARELAIPVYLYEAAARHEERRNLATIRSGEYEGLQSKLSDPAWTPDFPAPYNARSGATVIGVREFLIAYNVNLNTTDRRLAHDIALSIRETGRIRRNDKGEIVKRPDGTSEREPGLLSHVKAVGWYIEEYRQAQVSINLTNFRSTPPHAVYDAVRLEAEKRGLLVTGSELVGLCPLEALRMAGRHYLLRQGRSSGVSDEELIHTAVRSLGLDQLGPFDPMQKIVEYRLHPPAGPLASLSTRAFANLTASDAPAPGGGSVSGLVGALGASLVAMVANLTANGMRTHERRASGGEEAFLSLVKLATDAQRLKDSLLAAIDRDTDAFNAMMEANRTRTSTPEELENKKRQVRIATEGAIRVPLDILEAARDIAKLAIQVVACGNPNARSDAGVAGALAQAAAKGACYNVWINLKALDDPARVEQIRATTETLLAEVTELAASVEKEMSDLGAGQTAVR